MINAGVIIRGVEDAILRVLEKSIRDLYNAVPSELRVEYRVIVDRANLRVIIYTDTKMAAYIEFGTGAFAAQYLSSQGTPEMIEDALKFFETGLGTMPERPYLFPAYNRMKPEIVANIDREIQKFFNSLNVLS